MTDTYIDYNKEQVDKGQPISPFSEKKRLKMFIDSRETDYYVQYFPEDIEHLKSNYKRIEELEEKDKERRRTFRKAKLAKLPWWRRIFG